MKAGAIVLLLAVLLANDPGVHVFSVERLPGSFQGATITGQLVDARTFQPLRGAIVTAVRVPTGKADAQPNIGFRTGEDGKFVLRGVAPGIVNFSVSKAGYVSGPFPSVRPAVDGEQIDNVILTVPPGASVSGRVLDESGNPVAGVRVSFTADSQPPITGSSQSVPGGGAMTTEDGRYLVGGLPAGEYAISVRSFMETVDTTSSANDVVVIPNRLPDRSGAGVQTVRLTAGEDRGDVDLMIRFPEKFTSPRPIYNGTATIVGRIVDGNGIGIPHAGVMLRQDDKAIVSLSDAAGQWAFQKIPAGSFTIGLARSGINATAIGQAGGPVTLRVAAGSRTENVVLTARRGGTISGTLMDEFGDPASALVLAASSMRPELSSGTGVIVSRPGGSQVFGGPGSADARGRYRITGLPPGEYLVSVLSFDPTMTKTEVHFTDPAGQDRILSPGSVFYPGVPTASQASKVTVTEGGEAMGVDLTVRPVPMTQITVTTTASRPVSEIQLQQIEIGEPLPTLEKEIWMSGTTVTLDARPGRYRLLAFAEVALSAETAVRLWASADVDTDPSIPAAVDMHLEPGANISGRMVFEGTESSRQNAQARLAPVSPLRFLPANKLLPTDGKTIFEAATGIFSIEAILPGRYVIQEAGGVAGQPLWTLKAATIGGRDVLDEPIDLRPGDEIGNVRLTVTDRVIELSGKIVDDATRPTSAGWVLVFSTDRKHWWAGSRRIRSLRPDAAGAYTIRGLPAGSYVVTVVPDLAVLMDTARLAALAATGTRVTLAEGERKVQDLRSSRR
jgi:Carboxypeptidase regulatory-like domain